jgi:hypothetical protein
MQARKRLARRPAFRRAERVDSMDVKITATFSLEFASPAGGSLGNLGVGARSFSKAGDISFLASTLSVSIEA